MQPGSDNSQTNRIWTCADRSMPDSCPMEAGEIWTLIRRASAATDLLWKAARRTETSAAVFMALDEASAALHRSLLAYEEATTANSGHTLMEEAGGPAHAGANETPPYQASVDVRGG